MASLAETKPPSLIAGEMMECALEWLGLTPKEFAKELRSALGTQVRQKKLEAIERGDTETTVSVDFFVVLHRITGLPLEVLLTGKCEEQETYLWHAYKFPVAANFVSWLIVQRMIQRVDELGYEPEDLAATLSEKGMNWCPRYISFLVRHASKEHRISKLLRISVDELVILAEALDKPLAWFLK